MHVTNNTQKQRKQYMLSEIWKKGRLEEI